MNERRWSHCGLYMLVSYECAGRQTRCTVVDALPSCPHSGSPLMPSSPGAPVASGTAPIRPGGPMAQAASELERSEGSCALLGLFSRSFLVAVSVSQLSEAET